MWVCGVWEYVCVVCVSVCKWVVWCVAVGGVGMVCV